MVRRRRVRGFTLIELLIAMALASVGLMGLLALQVTATRGNAGSRNFIEAIGIAQERLETVESTAYASLPTLAEGTCPVPPATTPFTAGKSGDTTAFGFVGSGMFYARCTAVTITGNTTYVQVTMQWTDFTTAASLLHTVTVSTTRSP